MSLNLRRVVMEVIPHQDQRYDTVGDYWWEEDTLHIVTSDLGDSRYNFSVLMHEFIEACCCEVNGIPETVITEFDKRWETFDEATRGWEPGFHPEAPYFKFHALSDTVERLVAPYMGFWVDAVEKSIDALPEWVAK